jgi:hypothetical protein
MPFSRHSTGKLHLPADDGEQRLLAWNDPHHPRNPFTCLAAGAAGARAIAMVLANPGMGIGGAILVVLLVLLLLGRF